MRSDGGSRVAGGVRFGPNLSGKCYVSVDYHRPTSQMKDKTKWARAIAPKNEYAVFCDADASDWADGEGDYWGFRNGGSYVLGLGGEKLCKFPCPSNEADDWHGYPVSTLTKRPEDIPSKPLVMKWIETNRITRTFGNRILKGKV